MIMLNIEFKMVINVNFEQIVQSLQNNFFWVFIFEVTFHHIALKYRCPIKISNQIRHIYFYLDSLSSLARGNYCV